MTTMRNSGVNDIKSTQLATHSDCLTLELYKEWWSCTLNQERVYNERWNRKVRYEREEREFLQTARRVFHIEALLGRVE